jgi:haloacetate dehalogenase
VDRMRMNVVHGGQGPPVLLLHGYPQTDAMWHMVVRQCLPSSSPSSARICAGTAIARSRPATRHKVYSKRRMALEQVELMSAPDHERFALVGHDRGARVARRLALDHPDAVTRLALLDICPDRDDLRAARPAPRDQRLALLLPGSAAGLA